MRLLGLGDNVIDYYTNTGAVYPGGNAFNAAVHASILGAEAAYMGNLADDAMSEVIVDALNRFHVDFSKCRKIPGTITKCCRYRVTDGERTYLGITAGDRWSGPLLLQEEDMEYLRSFSLIHSSCNAKMEEEMSRLSGLPALFTYDFGEKEKYRTDSYYDKICFGLDLALFSCPPMEESEIRSFCEPLHKRNTGLVLITMGSSGQCVSDGTSLIYGKAEYIVPVDTMGAGDSFLTAFVMALCEQGWTKGRIPAPAMIGLALEKATAYSTANCMKKGSFGYVAYAGRPL